MTVSSRTAIRRALVILALLALVATTVVGPAGATPQAGQSSGEEIGKQAGGKEGKKGEGKGRGGKGPRMAAGPNAAVGKFRDLAEQPWAEQHIAKMNARGVIKGFEDGTFRANDKVTRAQVAALTVRLLNRDQEATETQGKGGGHFDDDDEVPGWARAAVALAARERLMTGTGGGPGGTGTGGGPGGTGTGGDKFQPNKPATRLDVAVCLVRALGLEEQAKANKTVLTFTDAADIPAWAVGYVALAIEKGLVTGYPDNTFQPNKPVSRAEIAALLDRTDNEMCKDEKKAEACREIKGKFKAYTAAAGAAPASITITKKGAEVTVDVAANATVYLKRDAIALADLLPGDEVVVVKNADGLAVFIRVEREDAEDDDDEECGDDNCGDENEKEKGDKGKGSAADKALIAALKLAFATDKETYLPTEKATLTLTVTNSAATPLTIQFSSGQSFDFAVKKNGAEAWRWSTGMAFTMAIVDVTLAAGEVKTYTAEWDLKDNSDQALTPGAYEVRGWLTGKIVTGDTPPKQLDPEAPAPKTVQLAAAPAPAAIGGLTVALTTNKAAYSLSEVVTMTLTLTNTTAAAIVLEMPTVQKYDFTVKSGATGTPKAWQWSDGRTFAPTVTEVSIPAAGTVTFSETWDQKNTAGQAVAAGSYTLEAGVLGQLKGGTAKPATPAAVTFTIAQP